MEAYVFEKNINRILVKIEDTSEGGLSDSSPKSKDSWIIVSILK